MSISHLGPTCDERGRNHIWHTTEHGHDICVDCKLTRPTPAAPSPSSDPSTSAQEKKLEELLKEADEIQNKIGWNAALAFTIRARTLIPELAAACRGLREKLLEHNICPECGKEDYSIAGDACANCGANIGEYRARIVATPEGE